MSFLKVDYAALTDIGLRRRNNEDSYVVHLAPGGDAWMERGHLFLVADGMGGHAVGELASKIAADTIPHTYHKRTDLPVHAALEAALLAANQAIHERGRQNQDFARMGTTCTALVLSPWGAILGHVGDSRTYRIRNNRIEQLTFDHSLQWELLRQGRFSPEEVFLREPRNVITRSLGPEPTVDIDVEGPYRIRSNDVYLLCSDGLCNMVKDDEIGMIAGSLPPADACRLLVDLANMRGGSDNITVVLARVIDFPEELEEPNLPDPMLSEQRLSWWWLLCLTVIGLVFAYGNVAAAMGKTLHGAVIEALAVLGFGAWVLAWLRRRRLLMEQADLPDVTHGTPYRTASAKLSRKFVSDIASLEYALQRTAVEESWSVPWPDHDMSYRSAKVALSERRYGTALREFGKALHTLMLGVQQQRRQRDLAQRWGVRPGSTSGPPASNLPPTPPTEIPVMDPRRLPTPGNGPSGSSAAAGGAVSSGGQQPQSAPQPPGSPQSSSESTSPG